jgi:peptide/nickel transport system substrate-binding protein
MRKSLLMLALAGALLSSSALGAAPNELIVGIQLEPTDLDPTTGAAASANRSVTDLNIYNGLTKIDETGAVQPDLATSWDVSTDGLTYIFHLKTGIKFSDGTPFSADDVKWTLDRDRAPDAKGAQKQLFDNIASVDVVDPATVKVTLSKPQGDFAYDMGWGDAVIVSSKSAATNLTKPIGTGPYQVGEWVKADHLTLVRNPNYSGTPPTLDKVTFRFISDPTAATNAMLAEDIDVFSAFPAPELVGQFKADPRFDVIIGSTQGETIVAMNNARPPLDNVKVREAIARAIDRNAIIEGAMFGYGTPIGSFYPPSDPAYIDLTALSSFDPAKSKQLLAEAGVKNLTLTFKVPPVSYARAAAPIIQQELAGVGVKVNVINDEWADWIGNVFGGTHDYDLTMITHVEPDDYAAFGKPGYYINYKADALNALVDKLKATTDPKQQIAIRQDIQKQLAADFAAVYLFEFPNITIAKKGIKGLWADAPLPTIDLSAISWAQ